MNAAEIAAMLSNFLKILASPGGEAALTNLFTDHGLTPEKVAAVAKQMPDAPAPKE
jgi:hypothetical protein